MSIKKIPSTYPKDHAILDTNNIINAKLSEVIDELNSITDGDETFANITVTNTANIENIAAVSVASDDVLTDTISVTDEAKVDTINEFTTNAGVTIDGVLIKDGGISSNSTFAGFYPVGIQQSLDSAGAINTTSYWTNLDTTGGALAFTFADGTQIGQLKKITLIADGGDAVITGNFYVGVALTTLTYSSVENYSVLMWTGTAWASIENRGGSFS